MPTPLVEYLTLQRALDRDILSSLRASAASVEGELRRLQSRTGIGNQMRSAQLAASQAEINRQMAAHWSRVGNLTAAAQANAAAEAAEAVFRSSSALSDVFDPGDLDYMTRSVRASAVQNVSTAMERVSGSSYVPLAESVYDNAALTSGKIDEIVTSALARGASAAELARDVRGFVNPNTPGGVRYASNRLARTELNNAFHASQVRQAQQEPWTLAMLWNLSGSHPKPDECNVYAEDTHFEGGEAGQFKPAEVPGKPHPNCLCYMTTVNVDRDEFIRQFEAGQYDTYLDDLGLADDGIARAAQNAVDIPLPNTASVSRVGSTNLADEMARAEAQRLALEKARFIQKGKGKGNLNPENGYRSETAGARSNYSEMLNKEMNLLKRDPEAFLAKNVGDDSWVEYVSEQNRLLEELMKMNTLTDDVTVQRLMTGDFGDLRPGSYMADPGFLSTTTNPQAFLAAPSGAFEAGMEAGNQVWTFVIQAKKGTNALPGADYQKEIFFGPGTKQRILHIDRDNHTVYTEIVN